MEENFKQTQQPKKQEPMRKEKTKRFKSKKAKAAVITISTIAVLLLGMQVYASVNGYGNVFFMIKNLITTGNPAGNQEIFSDKDITLSYKSIELAEGLKIQANRLEIKDGKTKLFLSIKSQNGEPLPLKYEVTTVGNEGNSTTTTTKITGNKPENTDYFDYEDVLTLDYEVEENKTIVLKINNSSDKELRTLEINLQTREITVKGEKEFEKISEIELKKYLNVFSELNNGSNQSDTLISIAETLIEVGGEYEGYGIIPNDVLNEALRNNSRRELINQIIKEIYGDKAKFEMKKDSQGREVEVLKGTSVYELVADWAHKMGSLDKNHADSYTATADMSEYRHGKCLKVEDIKFENDIYTVKYIYLLATINEEDAEKLEDLPQYETTIKLKRNENNKYSKYEIVSLEKGTEVKNKVSTNVNNNSEADFFEKNSNIQYNEDLTNSENGKAAIIKSGEEVLKSTKNNGYYTYTDMWNNSYNIKKIKDVKSEFIQLGKDKQSALYKCTIYYIDNNNKDKNFDVAVIVAKDAEGGILGTFDSYTGSTRYTRWSGLYNEDNEKSNINTSNTTNSNQEFMNTNNWIQYWPDVGMKFKLPNTFKQGQVKEVQGLISVDLTGEIVLPISHPERATDPKTENIPVIIRAYTEIHGNNVNIWDVLENSEERSVKSTDNRQWSDWYPLKNDDVADSSPNGYIRRSYGRVRGDMVEKVIFDLKTNYGMDVQHYQFIANVLESVSSTSR